MAKRVKWLCIVILIFEFPLLLILPMLLIATALTAMLSRRMYPIQKTQHTQRFFGSEITITYGKLFSCLKLNCVTC